MKVIATNYNADCQWIPAYTKDYFIYDRTNCGLPNRVVRKNLGDADFDKLTYIIDNYDKLPEVFMLIKTNLFKFITPEEFAQVRENTDFTPLLTKTHRVYEPICRYDENGIYEERNDSWYLGPVPSLYFRNYGEFASAFGLPNPEYLKFAPGGNYIVTRERIHRYPKVFYEALAAILPYTQRPGEAHMIERSYYNMWGPVDYTK